MVGLPLSSAMLAWLLIAAEITLMAAEVNVVLARKLWPRSLTGDLLPADERTMPTSGRLRNATVENTSGSRSTRRTHRPTTNASTSAPPKNLAPVERGRDSRARCDGSTRRDRQACFITTVNPRRSHSDLGPSQRAELENELLQPGSDAVTPEASGRG